MDQKGSLEYAYVGRGEGSSSAVSFPSLAWFSCEKDDGQAFLYRVGVYGKGICQLVGSSSMKGTAAAMGLRLLRSERGGSVGTDVLKY